VLHPVFSGKTAITLQRATNTAATATV